MGSYGVYWVAVCARVWALVVAVVEYLFGGSHEMRGVVTEPVGSIVTNTALATLRSATGTAHPTGA
jgi:hypothetical protein